MMVVVIMPRIGSNHIHEPNPGCLESVCLIGYTAPFTPHAMRSSTLDPG